MEYNGKLIPLSVFKKREHMSNKKVYPLIKMPGFPSVLIGHKYYIIEDGWIKWLDEQSRKNKNIAN